MSLYNLDSILNQRTVTQSLPYSLSQIQQELDTITGLVSVESVNLDKYISELNFLIHAEKQIGMLLANQESDGFTFAAQMTLSALGASMEGSGDTEGKTESKSRLVKIKEAIIKMFKRIADGLRKFLSSMKERVKKFFTFSKVVEKQARDLSDSHYDFITEVEYDSAFGYDTSGIGDATSKLRKLATARLTRSLDLVIQGKALGYSKEIITDRQIEEQHELTKPFCTNFSISLETGISYKLRPVDLVKSKMQIGKWIDTFIFWQKEVETILTESNDKVDDIVSRMENMVKEVDHEIDNFTRSQIAKIVRVGTMLTKQHSEMVAAICYRMLAINVSIAKQMKEAADKNPM